MNTSQATNAADELRRAYDALIQLSATSNVATNQVLDEVREFYIGAFQAYNRGDLFPAERWARAVKHLCHAALHDVKIKYLESHSEDLPHLPGLVDADYYRLESGALEIQTRLVRSQLTGLAERFGGRARKHIDRLNALVDRNTFLGEAFLKAAYEYWLATEALNEIEVHRSHSAA